MITQTMPMNPEQVRVDRTSEVLNGGAVRTLARVEHDDALAAPRIQWTQERIELIKRTVCPKAMTNDEFALFVEQCKRADADPLLREAFCVPRSLKVRDGDDWKWVERFEFQMAEAGMRSRADRFEDFNGMHGAAVYSKDVIEIDEAEGRVTHRYNPVGDRGQLIGAWAHGYRTGRVTPVTFLRLESRVQRKPDGKPTQFWERDPAGMIAKCARAEQWRLLYPNAFAHVTIPEERSDEPTAELQPEAKPAEAQTSAPAPHPRPAGASRTEEAKARVRQKAAQAAAPAQPAEPKPAEEAKVSPAPVGAVARFGGKAMIGRPLSELSLDQLSKLYDSGKEGLEKTPGAKWASDVRAGLAEIEDEVAARKAKQAAEETAAPAHPTAEREPGQDDVPF